MALRSPALLLIPASLLTSVLLAGTAPAAYAADAATPSHMAPQHGKKHGAHHRRRQAMTARPLAPLAAAATPAAATAPTPDQDVTAPPDWRAAEPSFEPRIMQLQYPTVGNGYLAGSSPSAIDNEHAAKVGGLELSVPLQP